MGNPAKIRAVVTAITNHGTGVYTLYLAPEKAPPKFNAGQFLHLSIDDFDPSGGFWPESRVFSIASRHEKKEITIVYSVKGRYTSRMQDSIVPGSRVWLKLPYGSFEIEASCSQCSDVVLVAGGTGISPFIPYLENRMESTSPGSRIHLFYGVRNPGHILFRDQLERGIELGILEVMLRIERRDESALGILGKHVSSGRLDGFEIAGRNSEFKSPVYFISGPPEMIMAVRSALATSGVDGERIKIDEWE